MKHIIKVQRFRLETAGKLLPQRSPRANKTAGGKVLVIAGSKGLWGAAILCLTAAARSGAGYVTLMTDLKKFPSFKFPDFLTTDISAPKKNFLNYNAVAIGPGLGTTDKTYRLLKLLIKSKVKNVVVDADALSLCARKKLYPLPSGWVLTHHEGELARLLNVDSNTIRLDRKKYVKMAQKKYRCIVLLKGHRSLVASSNKIYEIQTGNNALSKAGTGDVLTGIVTGFLAQGLSPLEATLVGATVHGEIADDWLRQKKDHLSLMASDLVKRIPEVFRKLRASE